MSVVSNELDFSNKGKESAHSSVRELTITPENGSQPITLSTSGVVSSRFHYGNVPHYSNISKIRGYLTVPAQASLTYSFVHTHLAGLISNIRLSSPSSGVDIVNVQDVDKFLRLTGQVLTSMDDFETNDKNHLAPNLTTAYRSGSGSMFFANNTASDDETVAGSTSGARAPIKLDTGFSSCDLNYVEQNYLLQSSAVAVEQFLAFEFDLGVFKETYLANNKLAYFPVNNTLEIQWKPTSQIGFGSVAGNGNIDIALTGTHTINNLELVLATESNVELSQGKMNAVRTQGSTQIIPVLSGVTNAHAAQTQSNHTVMLSRAQGNSLLAVYTEMHNAIESGDTACDISNELNDKCATQNFLFDNVQLTENALVSATNQDYQYMKHLIKGSCAQTKNIWAYNRVMINSWRQGPCVDWDKNNSEGLIDGISLLDQTHSWSIRSTMSNLAMVERYWFVFQRYMNIDPSGIVTIQ